MAFTLSTETFSPAQAVTRSQVNYATPVDENATATYALTLTGIADNTVLDVVTLTLYDEETKTVINTRQEQDILGVAKTGQNNVVISVTPTITWTLQALDNIVVDPTRTKRLEYHRAIFKIVVDAQVEYHTVKFAVRKAFTVTED